MHHSILIRIALIAELAAMLLDEALHLPPLGGSSFIQFALVLGTGVVLQEMLDMVQGILRGDPVQVRDGVRRARISEAERDRLAKLTTRTAS